MLNIDMKSCELLRRTELKKLQIYSPVKNAVFDCNMLPDGRANLEEQVSISKIDFTKVFTTWGLIDLQVNGFAGIDFNRQDMSAKQFNFSLMEIARTGVTSILPTVITDHASRMIATLRNLDLAVSQSQLGSLMVEGYHIEGPFLSKEDGFSGAHDPEYMLNANIELIDHLQQVITRPIQIMTVAPEIDGVIELIPKLIARGIKVAIGHSAANLAQIKTSIEAGASLSTHLGNALPALLHTTENQIFWQLAQDELTAMFIADGVHISKSALKTMLRAKGSARTILTTDAVAAAGLKTLPGKYTLGSAQIELSVDGKVRIPGSNYLAGSSATMDQLFRNLINWYDYTSPQILEITQINPVHLIDAGQHSCAVKYPTRFVEWRQTAEGPYVCKTHIGPFTIE